MFATANASEEPPWREALGPPEGAIPAAPDEPVHWREDVPAALAEARWTGRPVFVTWRCLPCKQCAQFDKDVLEGGPVLTPLLKRFITVRMTDAAQLDERYFPYRGFQDLDLSWWGYFLSSEGALYGVFGGKDHVSDTTRISEAALANTMRRVLAHHYDPRRPSWNIDGPTPDPSASRRVPTNLTGAAAYEAARPHVQKQSCLHCHQVQDLLHTEAQSLGTFDLRHYTQAWPLPENVGLRLDRDHGLLVTGVEPGSSAALAGLKPGDRLAMAERRKLFGQADFRGALHRTPYGDATIRIGWIRDGDVRFGQLQVEDGWRASQSWWRKSVYEGIIGPHLGFFPLPGPNQGDGSMSFRPFLGRGAKAREKDWWKAGLRPGMEIVSINGRSDDWNSRQLITWFRLHHEAGDRVALEVRQDGRTQTIVGKANGP